MTGCSEIEKGGFVTSEDAQLSGLRAESKGHRLIDPTERLGSPDTRPSPTIIRRLLAEWRRLKKGSRNGRARRIETLIGSGNYAEARRLMELDMKKVGPVDDEIEKAEKPPAGFTPIPGSKHGGYHKQVGGKWETWYSSTGKKASTKPVSYIGDTGSGKKIPHAGHEVYRNARRSGELESERVSRRHNDRHGVIGNHRDLQSPSMKTAGTKAARAVMAGSEHFQGWTAEDHKDAANVHRKRYAEQMGKAENSDNDAVFGVHSSQATKYWHAAKLHDDMANAWAAAHRAGAAWMKSPERAKLVTHAAKLDAAHAKKVARAQAAAESTRIIAGKKGTVGGPSPSRWAMSAAKARGSMSANSARSGDAKVTKTHKAGATLDPIDTTWADGVLKSENSADVAWLMATARDALRDFLRWGRTKELTTKTDEQLAQVVSDSLIARSLNYSGDNPGGKRLERLLKREGENYVYKCTLMCVAAVRAEFPGEVAPIQGLGDANGSVAGVKILTIPVN